MNYGLRSTFDMQFTLSDKIKLTGISGIEMQRMNTTSNGYKMGVDSTDVDGYNIVKSVSSILSTVSSTASYFTQWTVSFPKGFDLTAGIGLSSMSLNLEDRLWALTNNHPNTKIPQEYNATYKNMLSPNFALNKKFNNAVSVYASYSVGYKAPVSSYFYIPTTGEVNTGLKPEKGTQIEIGTKGSILKNKLFYTLSFFNAKFSDKMTSVAVQNPANTATLYSYIVNGGSLNNNGIEFLIKYTVIDSKDNFIKSLRPFANVTYSNFKYVDFQYQKIGKDLSNADSLIVYDYSGNSVAGVPPLVFNLGFDIETKIGFYGNVNFNYRDAMYFTSDELNQTESYSILNAKLGYRKTLKHFEVDVFAGANNITNTQYYYMVFLNQLPDAYLPAPNKINYFGGINLKYIF